MTFITRLVEPRDVEAAVYWRNHSTCTSGRRSWRKPMGERITRASGGSLTRAFKSGARPRSKPGEAGRERKASIAGRVLGTLYGLMVGGGLFVTYGRRRLGAHCHGYHQARHALRHSQPTAAAAPEAHRVYRRGPRRRGDHRQLSRGCCV